MKDTGVQRERKLKSDGLPQVVKREAAAFWEDESGVGVIEIVLILVVICTINLRCVLCVLWVFLTFKGYTVDSFNRSCILC